jgi:hypothetical protein
MINSYFLNTNEWITDFHIFGMKNRKVYFGHQIRTKYGETAQVNRSATLAQ